MIALKPETVVGVLFGNRLRQLLDERNISQAHFADRIGVSRSRMNNYVAQRSEPDYATLIRIANTLDTTIDFLLGKSEHQGLPQTACLSSRSVLLDPAVRIAVRSPGTGRRPSCPLRSGPHGRASALPVQSARMDSPQDAAKPFLFI